MEKNNQEIKKLLKKSGYSEKAIEYYLNKTNVGKLQDANSIGMHTGACGDTMQFSLKVEDNIIKDLKFQAIGCAAAYSSGSAITNLAKDKSIEDAKKLNEEDIIKHLHSFPKTKLHCMSLALRTLKKAIENYEKNKT